jgi:Zinc-uptake complex component A periplasmic
MAANLVDVVSIMSNPDQDPHLFETTPTVIRQVSAAQIVIFNGADYDPWMNKLLSVTPRAGRIVVNVAELVGTKRGANPHLWYAPATIPAVAKALAGAFSKADAPHAADYASRQEAFEASLTGLYKKIDQIRAKYAGTVVTATEPVFGYMVSAAAIWFLHARDEVIIKLAGLVGERLRYGREFTRDAPGACDAVEARALAETLVVAPEAVEELLRYCQTEAEAVVRKHWLSVEAVAAALERCSTLSAAEIDGCIAVGVAADALVQEKRRREEWTRLIERPLPSTVAGRR